MFLLIIYLLLLNINFICRCESLCEQLFRVGMCTVHLGPSVSLSVQQQDVFMFMSYKAGRVCVCVRLMECSRTSVHWPPPIVSQVTERDLGRGKIERERETLTWVGLQMWKWVLTLGDQWHHFLSACRSVFFFCRKGWGRRTDTNFLFLSCLQCHTNTHTDTHTNTHTHTPEIAEPAAHWHLEYACASKAVTKRCSRNLWLHSLTVVLQKWLGEVCSAIQSESKHQVIKGIVHSKLKINLFPAMSTEAPVILEFFWRNSLHPVDVYSGQMLQQKKKNRQ